MNSLRSFPAVAPVKPAAAVARIISPHWRRISACLATPVLPPTAAGPARRELSTASRAVMADEAKYIVGTYRRAAQVVFVAGHGCKLYDIDGREYLDMVAGLAVNALGHCDPDLVDAATDQSKRLGHASNVAYTVPQVELAKRLVEASFADRVFFANSGTEANEAAIKFSRKYQRVTRPDGDTPTEFVSFSNCFHGRTMGSLALTSNVKYQEPFQPVMPGSTFVEYGNLEEAKKVIQSGKIAAVFVEPVQGHAGVHCATKEFLQGLRDACDQAGALLVFDDVQCGMGRTGYLWAYEIYGVEPDMMTLAKPLANGLPIGVVLVKEKIAASINYGDHGTTFGGSPYVCQAALAVLDKIQKPGFLAEVRKKGENLKQLLKTKLSGNSHVKEIRGIGLIVGIELDVLAGPLVDACLDAGVLLQTVGKGNVVRLVPPLIISDKELEQAADVIRGCLPALEAPTS